MKKSCKLFFIAIFFFVATPNFAKDFDWSQCWCNYGGNIQKGDKELTIATGLPWDFFYPFNHGGWALPYITVDFQVAQPIWKLPFTFGGFASADFHESDKVFHSNFTTGASIFYHIQLPPQNLDVYAGNRIGIKLLFSKVYENGLNIHFDWGGVLGANYFFSKDFGVNLELGFPVNRVGVVFKF